MSVIAAKDGKFYSSFTPDCAMKHSVLLIQKIDEVLSQADMTPQDCGFFAAVIGAGSFTGIRIGISAMKGFCLACEKPALPITSFDVAAYNAVDGRQGKTLCLVNALHDTYYACGYENGKIVYPPAYLTESEVLSLANEGYSLRSVENLPIGEKCALDVVSPETGLKNAVLARLEQGAFGPLAALYIRKSSAELNAETVKNK